MKKKDLSNSSPNQNVLTDNKDIDAGFLAQLSLVGVFEAAHEIGLDVEQYLKPLAQRVDHNYRHYRWSVGYHGNGGVMINALPPEEESGWTPWERWYKDEQGLTQKESWVMYPLKNSNPSGIARWYKLDEKDLMPRYLERTSTLEGKVRQARIYEASKIIGFDTDQILINPLSENGLSYYQQCRWVVIPHMLSGDAPVIYILPPMNRSNDWPWESWYTDGKIKLIHHVHFTKENEATKGVWKEYPGAPQRPPEIFGVNWYWYNDTELKPAMADL
jgi:hypothetical protein